MISSLRSRFNENFSDRQYLSFLQQLQLDYVKQIDFHVAETPVFIDRALKEKILAGGQYIIETIQTDRLVNALQQAIPPKMNVPSENSVPDVLCIDWGLVYDDKGQIVPQLIELQGFPTLLCFQIAQSEAYKKIFELPQTVESYLSGYNSKTLIDLLRKIIIADEDPNDVVLLDFKPAEQKTSIDFLYTERYLGIQSVCITDMYKRGHTLYYRNSAGKECRIKRIYNRLIFDELLQQEENIIKKGDVLFDDLDISWFAHPNWFFKLSKYTLPFLTHPYIPHSYFLDEAPAHCLSDISNYVLKPLFSFAGHGVQLDISKKDIDNIPNKHDWILQKKVEYAPIIKTPEGATKVEIRIIYTKTENASQLVPISSIARLSRGAMMGVAFNKNKTWMGSSIAFFEQ
ncbi:MAG: hypothetical protein QM528_07345 [Phycisphaerales bacterium]|nr:hypothetical protein [Phycisphaerales bacterium]